VTRSRDFRIFAICDTLSTVISAGVAIAAAALGFGVWSLVIQQLLQWIIKALYLFPASKFRPGFVCDLALARPYLRFGINSAAANLADIIGRNLPPLVVGGTLGVTPLGHYSIAYQLTRIPDFVISAPIYLSVLTAVAQAPDRDTARVLVLRSLRIAAAALVALFCGLAAMADLATSVLLGPRWSDTAPVLSALAPAGLFICLYSLFGAVLLGLGNSARQFTLSLLCGTAIFIGSLIGSRFGTVGVAIGVSVGASTLLPSYVHAVAVELRTSASAIASHLIAIPPAAAVMILTLMALRFEISHLPDLAQLALAMAGGLVAYGAIIAVLDGRKFAGDLKQLRPGHSDLRAESPVV
jgi:PST family polysaccharide transporter